MVWSGALALALASGGCNAISGIDDFDFSAGGSAAQGGASSGTQSIATSSASTGNGLGGNGASGATGGTGGADCGPCDSPPNAECWEAAGECAAGQCQYQAKAATTLCDDGDACTFDETCDGEGTCGGGVTCPALDACHLAGTCDGGTCFYPSAADGTSCGATAALVCCGGQCVDISSNPDHCGGCGFDCAAGESCQSVAVSNTCEVAPQNTSGRCTCPGQNAKCPDGLVCRTQTPWNNLCSPASNQCPAGATFQEVNFCPNYCFY